MPQNKANIITKTCAWCNNSFEILNTIRGNKKHFCNYSCASKHKNTGRKHSKEINEKRSENSKGIKNNFFGKTHSFETKEKISNKKIGKKLSDEHKLKISQKSKGSNNGFYGKTHSLEVRSRIGRDMNGKNNPMFGKGDLLKGEKNGSWQGGTSFGEYGLEFNDNLKTRIRKRDSFTCAICGKNGYDVHHIDYNKKNNSEFNLITLCRKDHAKTNFNREYWGKTLTKIIMEKCQKNAPSLQA